MKNLMIEYPNGDKFWYLNEEYHREDGPAIEYSNGDKVWYINGKRHREDGPACEYSNGIKLWFINGREIKKEEFNKEIISLIEEEQYDMSSSLSNNEDYHLFSGDIK